MNRWQSEVQYQAQIYWTGWTPVEWTSESIKHTQRTQEQINLYNTSFHNGHSFYVLQLCTLHSTGIFGRETMLATARVFGFRIRISDPFCLWILCGDEFVISYALKCIFVLQTTHDKNGQRNGKSQGLDGKMGMQEGKPMDRLDLDTARTNIYTRKDKKHHRKQHNKTHK